MSAAATEFDRVRANTAPQVLQKIDSQIEERIRFYASQPRDAISRRIEELDREWDVERYLETNASALALCGVVLGLVRKKWLILSAAVLGLLLNHAIKGWCPPVPILRRLGVRTRREIDREKYALKILRGDFQSVPSDPTELRRNPANDVLSMVS
ncbi:MAG: hypothetical protein L0Y58_12470 [Verrucomicrobia subdivision 3 bacterium]|nr:hypothetical protein [Limisphaerales bacterium]